MTLLIACAAALDGVALGVADDGVVDDGVAAAVAVEVGAFADAAAGVDEPVALAALAAAVVVAVALDPVVAVLDV